MTSLTEAVVEQAALAWPSGLGWQVAHGPDIAPDARPELIRQAALERTS